MYSTCIDKPPMRIWLFSNTTPNVSEQISTFPYRSTYLYIKLVYCSLTPQGMFPGCPPPDSVTNNAVPEILEHYSVPVAGLHLFHTRK